MKSPVCAIWALGLAIAAPLAAQKWQIRYFYDKPTSTFEISDFQFSSPQHGIAVGIIHEGKREEPMSVVTSDGGLHWDTAPLHEKPISLFFLNENIGWMVTEKGIWRSAGDGKTWTKLPKPPGEVFRVYFLDENHGWAIGPKKTALETTDGGKTWEHLGIAVPGAGEDINYSAYTWIAFATPQIGLITGWNIPPKRFAPPLPDWVDPAGTLRQRDTPHLSFMLITGDGGKTWTPSSASRYGTVARIRFAPDGKGLGLLQYGESSRYPSEVYTIPWPSGASRTVYRDAKFAVSDIWMTSSGTAYLAGTQVRGQLRNLVPTPVQVLTSKDLTNWTPIPVDYRAEATGAILTGPDDDHLWMATDSGMILLLAR